MRQLRLSFLTIVFMITVVASAQGVYLGIKGGGVISKIRSEKLADENPQPGYMAGLALDYEFISNMSIQSGIYFVTKGAEYTTENAGFEDVDAKMYYLQIPLHYAYKIPLSGTTRFNVNAGPYVAAGIGGKTKVSGDTSQEYDTFHKIEDGQYVGLGYKSFDAGVGIGIGFEFNSFTLDVGWDVGLVNISHTKNATVKNQSGFVSVGYMF